MRTLEQHIEPFKLAPLKLVPRIRIGIWLVWISGLLFGLGLSCLALYALDVSCAFYSDGNIVCIRHA